jgi:hypothetical protein
MTQDQVRRVDTSQLKATVYTAGNTADIATLRGVASLVGGWTMYAAKGGWIDSDNGDDVTEPSTVIELIGDYTSVRLAVLDLALSAKRHGENEIRVTYENVASEVFDLR